MDNEAGSCMVIAATLLLVAFVLLRFLVSRNDCAANGGVLVQGTFGWQCVTPVHGKP